MSDYEFKFGQRIKCAMTGFSGNIQAVAEWDNGSRQYNVQQTVTADGSLGESYWMDHQDFQAERDSGCTQKKIEPNFTMAFGDAVKVKNTPYSGRVIGLSLWSNGCHRYCLRSNALHEGLTVNQWFDDIDLEMVKPAKKEKVERPRTGGPSRSAKFSKCP